LSHDSLNDPPSPSSYRHSTNTGAKEHKAVLVDAKVDYLEGLIRELKNSEEHSRLEKDDLRRELHHLKSRSLGPSETCFITDQALSIDSFDQDIADFVDDIPESLPPAPPRRNFTVVEASKPSTLPYHIDTHIPANIVVKAILESSVDAPCGVYSSAEPKMVLLRLLDDAHLPHALRSKIKRAMISGSAYGEISTERLIIRLERMTLFSEDGSFIETEVAGYVSGEDGKSGIRGVVIDRSAKLVASSAFSGFFSGVSQYIQSTNNAQNIAQATEGLPSNVRWDILRSSGLQGGSSGLEKISEYYIKRAEQIQPVIAVSAGRIVDVIFTHGCSLGAEDTHDQVRKVREDHENA